MEHKDNLEKILAAKTTDDYVFGLAFRLKYIVLDALFNPKSNIQVNADNLYYCSPHHDGRLVKGRIIFSRIYKDKNGLFFVKGTSKYGGENDLNFQESVSYLNIVMHNSKWSEDVVEEFF